MHVSTENARYYHSEVLRAKQLNPNRLDRIRTSAPLAPYPTVPADIIEESLHLDLPHPSGRDVDGEDKDLQ